MRVIKKKINDRSVLCPVCHEEAARHSKAVRRADDLGKRVPARLELEYSVHYCPECEKYFAHPEADKIIGLGARHTAAVVKTALEHYRQGDRTLEASACHMRREHHVHVPLTTLHDWSVYDLRQD